MLFVVKSSPGRIPRDRPPVRIKVLEFPADLAQNGGNGSTFTSIYGVDVGEM